VFCVNQFEIVLRKERGRDALFVATECTDAELTAPRFVSISYSHACTCVTSVYRCCALRIRCKSSSPCAFAVDRQQQRHLQAKGDKFTTSSDVQPR